jgi:hypothetical protein
MAGAAPFAERLGQFYQPWIGLKIERFTDSLAGQIGRSGLNVSRAAWFVLCSIQDAILPSQNGLKTLDHWT